MKRNERKPAQRQPQSRPKHELAANNRNASTFSDFYANYNRKLILDALSQLEFTVIGSFIRWGNDREVGEEELTKNVGILVSQRHVATRNMAGSWITEDTEIFLYPDGTLHKYRWSTRWEAFKQIYSTRTYVGPARDGEVNTAELWQAIELNRCVADRRLTSVLR